MIKDPLSFLEDIPNDLEDVKERIPNPESILSGALIVPVPR